jgi:hypothetical protein
MVRLFEKREREKERRVDWKKFSHHMWNNKEKADSVMILSRWNSQRTG